MEIPKINQLMPDRAAQHLDHVENVCFLVEKRRNDTEGGRHDRHAALAWVVVDATVARETERRVTCGN